MKLRVLFLIVVVIFLISLFGCNPTPAEHFRPFSVNLPESWVGRAAVEYLDDGVDIVIDGEPMLFLRLVENVPGARKKAEELMADGYTWEYDVKTANSNYFYFIKATDAFPEELYLLDEKLTSHEHAIIAIRTVIQYPLENDVFVVENFELKSSSTKTYHFNFGILKTNTYTNYISGYTFTIPEPLREKCWISIADKYWVTVFLRIGHVRSRFPLCQFFGFPPGHDCREIYHNQEYYPEVIRHEDGYLYGAINEWQPDNFRGYYCQPCWDSVPLNYRNMITTEEVRQIVDSFQILSQNGDTDAE